jgi:hypothetical protein
MQKYTLQVGRQRGHVARQKNKIKSDSDAATPIAKIIHKTAASVAVLF